MVLLFAISFDKQTAPVKQIITCFFHFPEAMEGISIVLCQPSHDVLLGKHASLDEMIRMTENINLTLSYRTESILSIPKWIKNLKGK